MVLEGKSVFGGIAIGRLSIYNKKENQVKREKITDVEAEITRFTDAKETAKEQLKGFYEKAVKEVGEVNAAIFEVHQMMLDDLDYVESITNMIRTQEVNAEFAVASTGDNFSKMFAAMDDDYMKERAADVKDISNRVISILQNAENGSVTGEKPVILLADDLAPSETVQLDKSKVLSFVTRHGSTNSHTAILARTMNIPALIGIDFSEDVNGKMGIVDGYTGKLYIEPDEETMKKYEAKKAEDENKKRLLLELKGKENVTCLSKLLEKYIKEHNKMYEDYKKHCNRNPTENLPLLYKLIFSKEIADEYNKKLEKMGYTQMKLFPGYESIIKNILSRPSH